MFAELLKKGLQAGLVVAVCTAGLAAQVNNDIFFKYCEVHPQKQCFNPVPGAIDSVGRDVNELGGGFQFCMKIDTVDAGFKPIRVVLVLDKSYSMCRNPSNRRTGCCTPGDSSGNCMMNDPNDMRIVAAHAFVDSLAKKSPASQVGVVSYDTRTSVNLPLSLDQANLATIHSWIDAASCIGNNMPPIAPNPIPTPTPTPTPTGTLAKTTGTKATYLGAGMQSGITAADDNYASIPAGMLRHIIQLTDGAWDDVAAGTRSPEEIINNYKTLNPDRPVPTIHGVFLSNVELHVAHKYPVEGCSNDSMVILGKLETATKLTGGRYFAGSTPQTVVSEFDSLLQKMTVRVSRQLVGMIITNTTNGEVRVQKTIDPVTATGTDSVSYYATMDNLPLVMGLNALKVQGIIKKGDNVFDTIPSMVNIVRSEKWSTNIVQKDYDVFCTKDSTSISITVSPTFLPIKSPFNVHSTINMKKEFVLDSVEVRVFTEFPNTDPSTIGVFHFENNLKNSADNSSAAGPSIGFSESNALFGSYSVTKGSFETGIKNLAGDFAFEAWIRLPANTTQTNLFGGNGFAFGIGADRLLSFTGSGIEPVRAFMPIDANSWTHVAVSRSAGNITLFVNGMNASASVPYTNALIGTATITCPPGGMLDEVRISNNSSRQRTSPGKLRLDIPSLQNPAWTLGGQSSTQSWVTLTPQMWNNGNIDFKFASPVMGKLVVNFQHKGTTETQWSKNGNAVFAAGDLEGPYVKNAIFTTGPLGGIYDTLQVFFSELVQCEALKRDPSGPFASFRIYGPDKVLKDTVFKGAYYVEAGCSDPLINQATIVVLASVDGIVPKLDSIQLFGMVVDTFGNGPDTARRGPIAYGGTHEITIVPYESLPSNPMSIPEGLSRRLRLPYGTIGKAIVVQTTRPLKRPGNPFTPKGDSTWASKTIIYDAVANVIAVDVPLKQFPHNDRLYYVLWSGNNRQGRRAAAGAYLFRATVQLEGDTQPKYLHTKLKWEGSK